MEREIKFRAWDKLTKTMLYQDTSDLFERRFIPIDGDGDDEDYSVYRISVETFNNYRKLIEIITVYSKYLMQFTGFKDKHGKDIYERDTVKFPDTYSYCDGGECDMSCGDGNCKELGREGGSGEIVYNTHFGGYIISSMNKPILLTSKIRVEIIGNVLEDTP